MRGQGYQGPQLAQEPERMATVKLIICDYFMSLWGGQEPIGARAEAVRRVRGLPQNGAKMTTKHDEPIETNDRRRQRLYGGDRNREALAEHGLDLDDIAEHAAAMRFDDEIERMIRGED